MVTIEAEPIFPQDLRDAWPALSRGERLEAFKSVPLGTADDFFLSLGPPEKVELLLAMPKEERRTWMRILPPDDAADVVQAAWRVAWRTAAPGSLLVRTGRARG